MNLRFRKGSAESGHEKGNGSEEAGIGETGEMPVKAGSGGGEESPGAPSAEKDPSVPPMQGSGVETTDSDTATGEAGSFCPQCGAPVEKDARFCTKCGTTLVPGEEPASGKKPKLPKPPVQPWAAKAGKRVKRWPTGVKVAIPLVLFVIIGIVVAIWILAVLHSPQTTIGRYCSFIKQGDYLEAHELVAKSGKFTTAESFEKWQVTQAEEIGKLKDYRIESAENESRFLGRLIREEPEEGTRYTVTMIHPDLSYDVNITVEDAGGVWPIKRYKLKLSEDPTKIIASPRGSRISIDGTYAGEAEETEFVKNALELKDLPEDLEGVVEYAKNVVEVFEGFIDELKRLARGIDDIVVDSQRILNKISSSGVSWGEVADSVDRTVESSKELWSDMTRTAINIYWIFGGGDDGSIRAELSRVETGLDIKSLPQGFHQVTVEAEGLKPATKDFIAPDDVVVDLKVSDDTKVELKSAMDAYYKVLEAAMETADPSGLDAVCGGELLDELTSQINDLASEGKALFPDFVYLKFKKFKMLASDYATVETDETWNYRTVQGSTVLSENNNVKTERVYTLERDNGIWKVIERKDL